MRQHFLLSPAARTLSVRQVCEMTDEEAHDTFKRLRFALNAGEPYCPHCGCVKVYTLKATPVRWKCSACRKKFSVTSGTIFHSRKLSIRDYLSVVALFVNGLKGVAALHMARDMNINPKSAFVLLHKLREAMGAEIHAITEIGGPGKDVEADESYWHESPRKANKRQDREDRRKNRREQILTIIRERGGPAIPWVVEREADAVGLIRQHVATGTTLHTDEAPHWNDLRLSYPMMRVSHKINYRGDDGANINQVESYFARLRRARRGVHHRISGKHLHAYADEMAWRENHRREANGTHWEAITSLALAHPKSGFWAGYWHRDYW
jgi:transposase-like protein